MTRDILHILEKCQQVPHVAHLDVAAHGVHVRIGEGGHEVPKGLRRDQRVGVDGDNDLFGGLAKPAVQRRRLSAVRDGQQLHPRVSCGDLGHSGGRAVRAAVVNYQHSESGIIALEYCLKGAADHLLLVVRRHEYEHFGSKVGCVGSVRRMAGAICPSPVGAEDEAREEGDAQNGNGCGDKEQDQQNRAAR